MEKEKLLNYRGQAPIRFLNDFNAGLLTADEYKLIRDLDKADAWDNVDEYISDAEPESPESLPAESPRPPSEETAPPKKKSIPLRTDVKIARNFFATPNEVIDVIAPLQTPAEECVYRRLFRWSYGWQRNHCRASIPLLLSTSKMKSRNTVRKALRGLVDKGHIAEYIDDTGRIDINNNGTLYIVCLPEEIDGLPEGGVKNDRSKNEGGSNSRRVNINPPEGQKMTGQKMTPPAQTPDNTGSTEGGSNFEGSKNDPIKDSTKDNSKNTLSLDPVEVFYTGIGQTKISKSKREKGNKVVQELETDGFSLEDIVYAAEWTPKNAKEKIYDMEILKHTIGEAISSKVAEQESADAVQKEADTRRVEEEERKRLEGEIQEMRAKMAEDEVADLREKALEELRNTDGIKKQFMSEPLIAAKENEILQREKSTK